MAITEWIDEEEAKIITALCPYCYVDVVIGSASGYLITEEVFMKRWEIC